jgi:hypothetical protein
MVSNLELFYLATILATFQKIGQMFPNHLVTLLPVPVVAGFEPLNLRLGVNWSTTELPNSGNTKGGSITVSSTSCLTGLESAV